MLVTSVLQEIALGLRDKADSIEDGGYGESDSTVDIEVWAEDLREAATLIEERKFTDLTPKHIDEIESAGAWVDPDLLEELLKEIE
jgi:hypothetical protein